MTSRRPRPAHAVAASDPPVRSTPRPERDRTAAGKQPGGWQSQRQSLTGYFPVGGTYNLPSFVNSGLPDLGILTLQRPLRSAQPTSDLREPVADLGAWPGFVLRREAL